MQFFLYIVGLILVLILRDEIYNMAPAAKLKQIVIMVSDIPPRIEPQNAPIPVVTPEIAVYNRALLAFMPPDFIGTDIEIPSG